MKIFDRKHPRLKNYDYRQNGYYYITVNTEANRPLLSTIRSIPDSNTVGRGLAPAKAEINLTAIGKIAEEQLLNLEQRYDFVKVDKYVIMPTHIHAIVILFGDPMLKDEAGASPSPTLSDVVCAFKSLTTRICNEKDKVYGRKIFQTSFYDEIIRNECGYWEAWQYIDSNPERWED